jgi:hypothetical protein
MTYRPFQDAIKFVHLLKLKSSEEWKEYCRSGKKPLDIPVNPRQVYGKEWKGFGDWLGTGTIASYNIKFRSYTEARNFVHPLNLKDKMNGRNTADLEKNH